MSFTQKLQLVLDTASTLPLHIDLGEYSYSLENGKFKSAESPQPGFRKLTRDELLQLMRRLHAATHAVLLNLRSHQFGPTVMQELAAPMAALSKLRVLVLSCGCPRLTPTASFCCVARAVFHDLLCAPRPSHLAGNSIGDAGCIALSSCLVHLSHLKELRLSSKFV